MFPSKLLNVRLRLISLVAFIAFGVATNKALAQSVTASLLERYYVHYVYPAFGYPSVAAREEQNNSVFTQAPPLIALQHPPFNALAAYPTDSRVFMTTKNSTRNIEFYSDWIFLGCSKDLVVIDRAMLPDTTIRLATAWRIGYPPNNQFFGCKDSFFNVSPEYLWSYIDTITFGNPLRRKSVDGGQYDASPMVVVRNGMPWVTYHWGYRLGLVANVSQWDAANLSKVPELATFPTFPDAKYDFELAALPPPWVEDDVVEYVNQANFPLQPGGQYFYAVRAEDKTLLDSIPAWQRSGKSFKSGGYVSACRFYGGKNGGPNTHFYSADEKECAALKTNPQLSYEGQTFAVNMPLPGANADGTKPCPIDSKPLYRVYNNASASNGRFVSNHRYFTDKTDVAAVVAQGWVDEGQVMCVPM